ncbi:GGDEF domain-containing protein [Methylobacterium iners]|uniref:diguanylate cyclase n=1 Tax=Methylobacterium iners TaxID=418707 RepID=A0ABQ4RQW9_9HYPH|nr:GGDEF domain-containing protein [Methylobacterium iners]GJD93161.1 Diguanylate cyclase VdcA [Methylobacterium iners]
MSVQQSSGASRTKSDISFAEMTWEALRQYSVPATPRNYELLYSYYGNSNREVSRRVRDRLAEGLPLTAEFLDKTYEDCVASDGRIDALSSGADEIAQASQEMVEQVTAHQRPMTEYGTALAEWQNRLSEGSTVEDLLKAVAALSLETTKASARNRALEQQLSASSLRIAKLRQDLIEVKQEATIDALTGIANRKALETKLRRAIALAKSDPSIPLCLLMLDVDHFKSFNDTHGHRTGDHVLRLVARLLSDNIKGKDTAARYGGEEFAILLAGADQRAGLAVATQICERIGKQRLVKRGTGESVGQITMSIGVAEHRPGENAAALVERADGALYEAKRTGRNRVCLSE